MISNAEKSFDEIAREFVASKQNKYYRVCYVSEFGCNTDILIKLTDEQVAETKTIIANCEAMGESLARYFECNDTPYYLNIGDDYYTLKRPVAIELECAILRCRLQALYFPDGFDYEHTIEDIDITLSANDYIALLKWQMEKRNGSFNDLLNVHPDIAQRISIKLTSKIDIETECINVGSYPAIIILKQIRDEVFELIGENDEYEDIYIDSTCDYNHNIDYHISFGIERNRATFIYNKVGNNVKEQHYYHDYAKLYDIDVKELKRVMGVLTHKQLVAVVDERFGNEEGLALFRGMLDREQIAYKIDE
jgi:hypothetical protein